MKTIDVDNWVRKEYFEFFSKYDDPFFGLTTEIDCSRAYEYAKDNKFSFFAYYLYRSIEAVNKIEELKYRIVDKDVVLFDRIHAGSTIGRKDGTFGFSFTPFSNDLESFASELKKEIEKVQNSTGLRLNEEAIRHDVIHYSAIPWHKFSAISHSKNFNNQDSVPKITFGKFYRDGNKILLPTSIDAHHGLVDGLHVGKYLEEFQKGMNE